MKLCVLILFFAEFRSSFFTSIEPYFEEHYFDTSTVFTCSGPVDTRFGIIKKGSVEVKETLRDSLAEQIVLLKSGQSFGEANLVDPEFSSLTCTIAEPSQILILTYDNFRKMTGRNVRAANKYYLNLTNIISERLVDLNKEFISLYHSALSKSEPEA